MAAAKAVGSWLLHERTKGMDLDLFVVQGAPELGGRNEPDFLMVQEDRAFRRVDEPTLSGPLAGNGDAVALAAGVFVEHGTEPLIRRMQVLELRAREQTSGAIRALLDLAPKIARRIKADGTDEEVRAELLQIGLRLPLELALPAGTGEPTSSVMCKSPTTGRPTLPG